jgi:hypothetical protein
MKRCCSPLSPMACRAAVIRLVNVDSETIRDRRQQVILAGDAIPVRDEIRQEIEYLWFDLDQVGAAPQLAPLQIESVVAE